ncbi:MAG: NADH-quinone oxidoreductase subunit L, partial [Candidatus Omnitrophota bacterium]
MAGYYLYAGLAILGSVITLAYFLALQRKVFFGKLAQGFEGLKEAGVNLTIPSVILAAIIILTGIFFPLLTKSILFPVGF